MRIGINIFLFIPIFLACFGLPSYFIRLHAIYKNRQIQCFLIKIMIAAIRISKYIGFSWFRLCSPFSSEKMKSSLSQSAQRAVWSSTIVTTICNAQGSEMITDPSLREKLLNLQHPADSIIDPVQRDKMFSVKNHRNEALIFDPWIRDQLLRIFSEGTELSVFFFKRQILMQYKGHKGREDMSKKFVFCPNLIVTKSMFETLINFSTNTMVYGGFGIGKTAAVFLFNFLSSIVNKFTYQSYSNKVQKQELRFLRENRLITDIPKLFYYSLNLADRQIDLKRLIIAQATELSDIERMELEQINDYKQIVSIIYDKYTTRDIKVRTVIDQINTLAAIFRQCNYFQTTNPEGQKERTARQQIMNIKKKDGKLLLGRMEQMRKLGCSTFYNSSVNIEDELLQPQAYSNLLTLDIQNRHVNINKFVVPYLQNLRKKGGCNDFTHIFWFSIEKILKRNNIGQLQLYKLKNIFYQQLKHKKWPIYVRFLNIQNMLNKDYNVFFGQNIETKFSETNFKQTTKELAQGLKAFSIKQYQQNLKKFIKKTGQSEQTQREKLYFLNVILKIAQQSNQTSEQCLQIDIHRLISKLFYDIQSHDKISLPFVHKQLFWTQYSYSMIKIKFLFTAKEFIAITKDVINQETMEYFRIDPKLIQKFLFFSKHSQGSLMEFTLIQILRRVGTKFKFEIRRPNDVPLKLQFKTKLSTSFLQMNKSQQPSLGVHFKAALQLAEKNPNQYIFASPIRINKSGESVESVSSQSSKCFDFAFIILNTSTTPLYEIYTFEAANSSTYQGLYHKSKNARNMLTRLTTSAYVLDSRTKFGILLSAAQKGKLI